MRPARRRSTSRAASTRRLLIGPLPISLGAGRRGGFTLVEMMVSVTLVMLMMLMFAEIYGLAQETISKQKGIATNDQKARILAEVLRTDLESRTFRSVYPFKTEMHLTPSGAIPPFQPESNFPIIDGTSGLPDSQAQQLLAERRGYFCFSENDPDNDGDDILQLTINVASEGAESNRIYGKATSPVTSPPSLDNTPQDGPENDDARLGDASGSSPMAEVTYFLRYGNLYRSVLLIRKPYLEGDDRELLGAHTQGQTTPAGFPADYPNFWAAFDYSAYRDTIAGGGGTEVTFHGKDSLSNNPLDNQADPYPYTTAANLYLPRTLGAPPLRFGHSITFHGLPLEFAGTLDSSVTAVTAAGGWDAYKLDHPFFGRFVTQERSSGHATFTFPGSGLEPFKTGLAAATDGNSNGIIDAYESGTRRGVDLMLPNVHGFDVKVWDDIERAYVDLGHSLPVADNVNPYTGATGEPGFYHISRLRKSYKPGTPTAFDNFDMDYTAEPQDFGNRYDTWSPNTWIPSAAAGAGGIFAPGTMFFRTGRAPYRPLQANPDPNSGSYIATDPTDGLSYEERVQFGDSTLDDDSDGIFREFVAATGKGQDSDAEAPLRAIQITVRYLDPHSGQTRQATIEQSLID